MSFVIPCEACVSRQSIKGCTVKSLKQSAIVQYTISLHFVLAISTFNAPLPFPEHETDKDAQYTFSSDSSSGAAAVGQSIPSGAEP